MSKQQPTLFLPLLQSEQDPTATDMRAIQSWAKGVPSLLFNAVGIGNVPPPSGNTIQILDSVVGTTNASGELTVTFLTQYNIATFSFGYLFNAWPGDVASALTSVVPDLSASDLTEATVVAYSGNVPINTGTIRVNFSILGA